MRKETLLLKNGTLIDGTGRQPLTNAAIEVINGRFGTITQYRDNQTKNEVVQEIDLNGMIILPGFIHTHAHTSFKFLQNEPLHGYHQEYLAACLREGITTITAPGGYGGQEPIGVGSAQEARLKVREVLEKGVHFIKTALELKTDMTPAPTDCLS